MRRFALVLACALASCGSGDDVDVPRAGSDPPATTAARTSQSQTTPPAPRGVPRPPIRQWHVPFSQARRNQMAAYAYRHYRIRDWRLRQVRAIVEHFSVTSTARQVFNTFAANDPDPELRERPGVCAHFVIGRDGRIYQLVDLGTMCRHAFGLNHVSVGIEHVGFSDAQVLGNRRQLAASLALTRWLRCRYGIPVADVIGHAEVPRHRLYRELSGRNKDNHGDFSRRSMTRYRRDLARRPCPGE